MRFNVIYGGGEMDSNVTASYIRGLHEHEIESVWIVDANRVATRAEVRQLCDGTWQGI